MKTIAHYFTSPNMQNEPTTEKILNEKKKQLSVKLLLEKSNYNGNKSKSSGESKKFQVCKKLKFDSEKMISVDSINDPNNISTKSIGKKSKRSIRNFETNVCSNGESTNKKLKTDNFKQTLTKNNHIEEPVGVISKSLKRKSISEGSKCQSKKKKNENDQINLNEKMKKSDVENIKIETSTKNNPKVKDLINFEMNKSHESDNDPKKKRKNSLQNMQSKKTVDRIDELVFSNGKDRTNKRKLSSKLKNNSENEKYVEIVNDSELDSSLEIFNKKSINNKSKTTALGKDCKESSTDHSPTERTERESLFNYFSKVDKEILMPKEYNKIKVKALVHSPPKKEPNSSSRKSVDKLLLKSKMNGVKVKAQLRASDKIDIISSEVIVLEDEIVTDKIVCVLSDSSSGYDKVISNKKCSGIENYFKSNSTNQSNTAEITPKTPISKPWTMRVRLTPHGSECLEINDDSSMSCTSPKSSVQSLNNEEGKETCIKEQKLSSARVFSIFEKEEKLVKPIVDPSRLEARAKFLESGTPDVVKRKVDFLRSETITCCPAPFPSITHVQQQDVDSTVWTLRSSDFTSSPSLPKWEPESLSSFSLPIITGEVFQSAVPLKTPGNIKTYLQELKNQEPDIPVNTMYKSLREKKRKFKNSEVWTEVYKPESVSDIIGNTENINKLKTWLQVQKNIRKREGSVSSGDEFVDSGSEGEDKPRANNITILAGPYGCGKTCAVYTVANELGCEVLEINSSCNRSGKRLLAEFSESTQSHNVDLSQTMLSSFSSGSTKKLKKKKSKRESNETSSGKTSLLLVEDAEILFANHDEGYVSAVAALISTSKRPVVLTVNDQKCVQLSKFDPANQLQLVFNKPRASKLMMWLRIVALVEGIVLTTEQSQALVEWSRGDVRRSLLQLQLIVQSKISQGKAENNLSSLWWNWPTKYNLTFQLPTLVMADVSGSVCIDDKEKIKLDLKSISKLADNLAKMDVLSSVSGSSSENPFSKPWQMQQVHATTLTEEESHCFKETYFNMELSDWLAKTVLHETETNLSPRFCTSSEKRWGSVLKKANDIFLSAVALSQQCNHCSVTLDYLPALRTLGRAEEVRLASFTKRANRYFSYLKGLGIHANKSFKDFMCDCFSQENL